jgi:outer membrane protein assembly factor BamB
MRRRHFLGALLPAGTAGCLQFEDEAATESATDGAVTGTASDLSRDEGGSTPTDTGAPDPATVALESRWVEDSPWIGQMTVLGRNVIVNASEGVRCLDVETGEERWQALGESVSYVDQLHSDGGSIFVFAGGGDDRRLYVLDSADGTVRGSVSYERSPGDQPIVTSEHVIFGTLDTEIDESLLYAVDRERLEIEWTTTVEETSSGFSGGVVAAGTVHVGFHNSLRGFSLSDGSLQYRSPLTFASPVAFEDSLVAAKRDTFVRIALPSLSVEWELPRKAIEIPEVVGDRVFSKTRNGVFAVDATDGTELWHDTIQESSSGPGGPSIHGNVLWLAGPDNAIYGYAAESGEQVHEQVYEQSDDEIEGVEATDHGLVVRLSQGVAGYAIEDE